MLSHEYKLFCVSSVQDTDLQTEYLERDQGVHKML